MVCQKSALIQQELKIDIMRSVMYLSHHMLGSGTLAGLLVQTAYYSTYLHEKSEMQKAVENGE
jgi:hypothetical protein